MSSLVSWRVRQVDRDYPINRNDVVIGQYVTYVIEARYLQIDQEGQEHLDHPGVWWNRRRER